jgi:hypothetical protein
MSLHAIDAHCKLCDDDGGERVQVRIFTNGIFPSSEAIELSACA